MMMCLMSVTIALRIGGVKVEFSGQLVGSQRDGGMICRITMRLLRSGRQEQKSCTRSAQLIPGTFPVRYRERVHPVVWVHVPAVG